MAKWCLVIGVLICASCVKRADLPAVPRVEMGLMQASASLESANEAMRVAARKSRTASAAVISEVLTFSIEVENTSRIAAVQPEQGARLMRKLKVADPVSAFLADRNADKVLVKAINAVQSMIGEASK